MYYQAQELSHFISVAVPLQCDLPLGRTAIAPLSQALCTHILTLRLSSFLAALINSFTRNATPYSALFTCIHFPGDIDSL
jgi:hypothetical protein